MSGKVGHLGEEAAQEELPASYYAGLADALLLAGLVEEACRCIDLAYAAADRRCSAAHAPIGEMQGLPTAESHQN